jgi:hypothetical protein
MAFMYHIGYVPVKLHTGSFGDANFLVQCSSSRCAFRGHSRTLAQARVLSPTIEHMTIQQMEHVGIVVDDLAAATEFFVELGLVLQGRGPSKAAGWTASWGSRASGRTMR